MKRYVPWVISLTLGTLLVVVLRDTIHLGAHVAFAEDQTAIFEEMRDKAAQSPGADISALAYVQFYYPSGTKQDIGSKLDLVVERGRRNVSREIIAILKAKSGKDFGGDPKHWIEGLKAPEPR